MQPQATLLVSNSALTVSSLPQGFPGGRSVLMTQASSYGAGIQLQILINTTWINVGSAVTSDGLATGQDLPAGQYRISGSSATALTAVLAVIPY